MGKHRDLLFRSILSPIASEQWFEFKKIWISNSTSRTSQEFDKKYPIKVWVDEFITDETHNLGEFVVYQKVTF